MTSAPGESPVARPNDWIFGDGGSLGDGGIKGEPPVRDPLVRELQLRGADCAPEASTAAGRSASIAASKVVSLLMHKDGHKCVVNVSVYDAAIVIPQITRSMGYPKTFVQLSIQCYLYLFMNLSIQVMILYMVCQEEMVIDKFSSEMNLCDFGANMQDCPGGINCIGPSGTNYQTAGRLYSWSAWNTRNFARNALKALFPKSSADIDSRMDPGEYGVESSRVRYICVFVFMMSVMSDLRSTLQMIDFMRMLPTAAEPWLEYRVPTSWGGDKAKIKQMTGKGELDFVRFKFAGIPLVWKVITWCVIIIPKATIWYKTSTIGAMFLMETAGIEDAIVNVTALTFILNLDEMLCQLFVHKGVQHILGNMEPYVLGGWSEFEETGNEHMMSLEQDRARPFLSMDIIPWRVLFTIALTCCMIGQYYWSHCETSSRGGLVSKAQRLPAQQMFPWLTFLAPWIEPEGGETYWSYQDHT